MKKHHQLELFIRNLKNPDDYYHGTSSRSLYYPKDLVFFSRLNTAELSHNFPIVHYRFNLVFCLQGVLQIHIDNYLITIPAGESLLIFPYQYQNFVSSEDTDILCLFIGFDMQERKNLEILQNNPVKINAFVISCLEQIISVSDEYKVNLLATILLSSIENCSTAKSLSTPILKNKGNLIIAKVQKYVYTDLSRIYSPAIISKELGISESNLYKQFKRAIGISPGRYLREVKINYACSILETRELSVTETALHCGFDSIYSFSRAFKKVMGYSPSQFRKRKK